MIDSGHYASDQVSKNLDELNSAWTALVHTVDHKGSRLSDANQGQGFNRDVDDVEMWLTEVESQLANEDYGKDSASVQNLQKRNELLEQDIAAHQDRIDNISKTADRLLATNHFDATNIANKRDQMLRRFENLKVSSSSFENV